jgi:phenylacetate-CoA ligase
MGDERIRRLSALLEQVLEGNAFQRARLGDVRLETADDLAALPTTTKEELLADQAAHPPFGTNLSFGLERYTHLHQTSGSTGATLRVLDTAEDWAWWRAQIGRVLAACGIGPGDRVALAYSFGP